jgi:formate hydrogenlyase transcriptional activator
MMTTDSNPEQKEGAAPRDDVAWLRSIVEGTASSVGDDFLRNLVRNMALAIGSSHAFVAEFSAEQRVRTLAYWKHGHIVPNIEFELSGTPCEEVVSGGLCHFATGVQARFPRERGIESYLGVPLLSHEGKALGHLCVFDEAPMPADERKVSIFKIFAARAAAELDRLRVETRLRESEDRFRDLFEEAPIAYVHEGLDTKFIRANRAALKSFGIKAEDVEGTYGRSFVPETPSAQKRLHDAFDSVEKGVDTSGVVLELRRKDTGAPLWIQWWSKPDPGGKYTRTMFVDITERILLEQEQARLQAQNLYLQEELKSVHNFEEIVGASPALQKVLDQVNRVAPTDASVLIWGETGTGKELIARAIHSTSARADKPFIKINCAALPAGLVESELFGHERGAFSGAIQRRIGRFELAHGGTIFLDEIGEVPKDVQVKLLRVLQEREFERVGGSQTIKCDVRVVAASNRILEKAIQEGDFRADLYYRLNVFPINMPALRDRKEDIPLLVQFFAQKYGPRVGRRIDSVDGQTLERLSRYPWPGNIRELENIIERALILSTTTVLRIDPDAMGLSAGAALPAREPNHAANTNEADDAGNLNSVQRTHILNTLRDANWVIEGSRGAAVRLGVKPATLRHRMKKLGIARDQP